MQSRLIAVLCLVLSSLCSFAQRVNEHGLKMVSEVEIFDWELDKIIFKYNEQNRLIGMTVYKDWNWDKAKFNAKTYTPNYKLYAEYNIKNGKMTCKRYDEEYSNPLYDFKFDEWGHIVSFKEKCLGGCQGDDFVEYEYEYSYDDRMKRYVSTDGWFRHFVDIREGKNLNFDTKNDTNISIWWILTFDNCEYLVDYYFMISEWMDCINDYMLKPTWNKQKEYAYNDNQYEYYYDSRGNLIEVREYNQFETSSTKVIDGVKHCYYYTVDTAIKIKYIE